MDINQKIKFIIKEADLYHNQGLLKEAESKYREILKIFHGDLKIENAEKIKKAIEKKIRELDAERKHVEKKVMSPPMTKASQDLITQMFVDAEGGESPAAKLEGAKALIKFGQFDRAVEELKILIQDESIKFDAAKQIITCFVLSLRVDEAISQIENWISSEFLPQEQLEKLIRHAQDLFRTRGVDQTLPELRRREKPKPQPKTNTEDPKPESSIAKKGPEPAPKSPDEDESIPQPKATSETNITFKKDSFFFEEDFEEYDILASVKKSDKSDQKEKK